MSPADIHYFPVSENTVGPTVLGNVQPRWHAHLCPECRLLRACVCEDGWKVAYVSCGCGQEPSAYARLEAEREELLNIARLARVYLSDVDQRRGCAARRGLILRINTVLEGR